MTYSEKLKNPKWQKKRLEILNRDNFTCKYCSDTETELQIHHLKYSGKPWEAPNENLITCCKHCHSLTEFIKKVYCSELVSVDKFIKENDMSIFVTIEEFNGAKECAVYSLIAGEFKFLIGFPKVSYTLESIIKAVNKL